MLTGEPPGIVRNCRRLSPTVLATTTEAGDLRLYEYCAATQQSMDLDMQEEQAEG
jgi:hypothetical protein